MDSYPGDFPFGIMDVVELLHLRIRRRQANSVYVDCPFCVVCAGNRRKSPVCQAVRDVCFQQSLNDIDHPSRWIADKMYRAPGCDTHIFGRGRKPDVFGS